MKKGKALIAVLAAGIIVSVGLLAGCAADTTGPNLQSTAVALRNSLDAQMLDQYRMVQSWAKAPILLEAAKEAQGYGLNGLYECWSAEATREYDEGEAVGDGDAANDISPEASNFLITSAEVSVVVSDVFITDYRGYVIAANGATGDFDQGPNDWRVFLDEGGKPYFKKHKPEPGGEGWYRKTNESPTRFWAGEAEWDDGWIAEISLQLRDPDTDEYLGQIKVTFNYGKIASGIVDRGETYLYEIKVVTPAGIIAATSEADQTKVNNEAVNLSNLVFFKEVQTGKTAGFTKETDEDGEEVYIGYAVSRDVSKHIIVVSMKAK